MIIRGAGQGLLLGGGFLYPSFMPAGQYLLDLQSKKGTHQKITRIILWSQLVKRSTGTVVLSSPCWCHSNFYEPALLQLCFICWIQKEKKRKVPDFIWDFLLVLKASRKRLFSNCLQQILLWSLICVQRWNLYLLLWLFGLRSCEQVVELFFGRRSLFELFGVPHLVCLGVFGVPRLVLVQAQMGATRKPHNRWGLFGEDTFNASSQHQANIGQPYSNISNAMFLLLALGLK